MISCSTVSSAATVFHTATMSTPTPRRLSDLIAFVQGRMHTLPDNPTSSDVINFGAACAAAFEETNSRNCETVPSNRLFATLARMVPILNEQETRDAFIQMEESYRILEASEFASAFNRTTTADSALETTPIEHVVFSPVMYHGDLRERAGYGQHIPEGLRSILTVSMIKLCCIFSVVWGFYTAHEDHTMRILFDLVLRFGNGDLPESADSQASPICSRSGLILGWNCGMTALQHVLQDRERDLAATPCTMHQLTDMLRAACRAALAQTARYFCAGVPAAQWTFGETYKFHNLQDAFQHSLYYVVTQVAPGPDPDNMVLRFSLRTETQTVTPENNNSRFDAPQVVSPFHAASMTSSASRGGAASSRRGGASSSRGGDSSSAQPRRLLRSVRSRAFEFDNPGSRQTIQRRNESDASTERTPEQVAQDRRNHQAALARADRERHAAQRERTRVTNANVGPVTVWADTSHNLVSLRDYVGGSNETFAFEAYNPNSDDEEDTVDASKLDLDERTEVEVFFLECIGHRLDRFLPLVRRSHDSIWFDRDCDYNWWLDAYFGRNRLMFQREATRAGNADEYAEHNKALMHLNKHFEIQRALFETFPQLQRSRRLELLFNHLHNGSNDAPLHILSIRSLSNSRMLTNLTCTPYYQRHTFRRSTLDDFGGLVLCIGIVYRHNNNSRPDARRRRNRNASHSPVSFMMCRELKHERAVIDASNDNDELLRNVQIELSVPRHSFDAFEITEGDVVHLTPVCKMVTTLRELKAIHSSPRLPANLQRILFGASYEAHPERLPEVRFPRTRSEFESSLEPLENIRARVDPGCLAYVDSLPDDKCDASQRRALLTTLAVIGGMQPNSSSLSLIIGPPGCGKSHTISLLCMSLMHHSHAGHCRPDDAHPSVLVNPEKRLRYSTNPQGCRVLVTCSSNYGADQVALKLSEELPMGDGSMMHPLVVRVARRDHDLAAVAHIGLHELAAQYDVEVYNVTQDDAPVRREASLDAMRALMSECVIVVCTNATAAGPLLPRLELQVSAVLVDEAAHSSEMETLMALVANLNMSQQGRLHAVLVGDPMQLRPLFVSHHEALRFLDENRSFNFPIRMLRQFESMFERLYRTNRCTVSWLTHHYRCHPAMARLVTRHIYRDLLQFPRPESDFDASYNTAEGPNGLQPLTIIDTRLSLSRRERDGRHDPLQSAGSMYNATEYEIVNRLLHRIFQLCGDIDLTNEIIVASPYQSQVELLRARIRGSFCNERNGPGRDLNVLVDSIDALQGSERQVAIISLCRSNRQRNIGFLTDAARLNVAVTRAKRLLILVGDFSTMTRSRVLSNIYNSVTNGAPRTRIEFHRPSSSRAIDEHEQAFAQRIQSALGQL